MVWLFFYQNKLIVSFVFMKTVKWGVNLKWYNNSLLFVFSTGSSFSLGWFSDTRFHWLPTRSLCYWFAGKHINEVIDFGFLPHVIAVKWCRPG